MEKSQYNQGYRNKVLFNIRDAAYSIKRLMYKQNLYYDRKTWMCLLRLNASCVAQDTNCGPLSRGCNESCQTSAPSGICASALCRGVDFGSLPARASHSCE